MVCLFPAEAPPTCYTLLAPIHVPNSLGGAYTCSTLHSRLFCDLYRSFTYLVGAFTTLNLSLQLLLGEWAVDAARANATTSKMEQAPPTRLT